MLACCKSNTRHARRRAGRGPALLLVALLALPPSAALPSLATRSPKPRQAHALLVLAPPNGLPKGQHHKGWRAATAAAAEPEPSSTAASAGAVAESCPEGATLPLLLFHPNNQSVSPQEPALLALARLPAPVCVLSALGSARDGKSSWLNLFSHWLRSHWDTSGSSGTAFAVDHDLMGAGTSGVHRIGALGLALALTSPARVVASGFPGGSGYNPSNPT